MVNHQQLLDNVPSVSTTTKNKTRKKRVPPYAKFPHSLGGSISGYAGDMESSRSPILPSSIELTSRQKKRYAIVDVKPLYPDGKRPKPSKEELNYVAKNALQELQQASTNSDKTKSRRPRVFPPNYKVDMSQVTMIPSRVYDAARQSKQHIDAAQQQASLFQLFEQVASETAHVYRETPYNDLRLKDFREGVEKAMRMKSGRPQDNAAPPGSVAYSDSSGTEGTSSFTESDGDDYERSSSRSALVFVGDAVTGRKSQGGQEVEDQLEKMSSSFVSLEKALGFSERPKIVALSTAPHLIIHANAAFQRSSVTKNLVGKPIGQVFGTSNCHEFSTALNSAAESGQQTTISGKQFASLCDNDETALAQQRSVSVYPVGSLVGHFATHIGVEVFTKGEVQNSTADSISVALVG